MQWIVGVKKKSVRSPTAGAVAINAYRRFRRWVGRKPQNPRRRIGSRRIYSGLEANGLISEVIGAGQPAMIARLGTTESAILEHYVRNKGHGICSFPPNLSSAVLTLSGFFPPSDDNLSQFARQSLTLLKEADLMGVRVKPGDWQFWKMESFLLTKFASGSKLVRLSELMPIGDKNSWTSALQDKKVLVIHPFSRTIETQYRRRHELFTDSNFLPRFDLQVLPAVQSVGTNSKSLAYSSWFDALDHMKRELATRVFDVALIGAGAYGLFLAAECKKLGAIGIQVGGALQLLFGIKGERWTNSDSPDAHGVLPHVNDSWVSPLAEERPLGADAVEGGCYW